jgi:two-component system NtrC family sensor kinase
LKINPSILIGFSDKNLAEEFVTSLKTGEFNFSLVNTGNEVIDIISRKFFHVIFVDISLSDSFGVEILRQVKSISPSTEVILFSDFDSLSDIAVQAMKEDAFAYIEKPFNVEYVKALVLKALEGQRLKIQSDRRLDQLHSLLNATEDINSQLNMKQLLRQLVKRSLVITESECGSIALFGNDKVMMREFWDGKNWQDISNSNDLEIGTLEQFWKDRNIYTSDDSKGDDKLETFFLPLPWVNSYICVPIVGRKGDFLGVIEVCNKNQEDFSQDDGAQLLEGLARTAAIAIENAKLYEYTKLKSDQLKESEQKYRTLVENSPDLIFIIQNNRFRYVNRKAFNILLYTPDEFYGLKAVDIISSRSRDVFVENINKKLKGEEISNYEVVLINKNKEEVILDVNGVLTEYEQKPAVQIIARDITDRRKADKEMLRLAAAVRSLNSSVTITDMNGNIIYINPIHKKVFGYELEELMGKQSSILYPFDDPSGVSKKIYEAILIVGWEGERLGMRKNGEVFPVYEKTAVVKDKDGRQIGIVSVVEEITLRKRLEQALKESEERYRTLVETAKSAIIAINEDGKILLFNPSAEELFGYTKKEIEAKELNVLISDKYRDFYKIRLGNNLGADISSLLGKTIEVTGIKKGGDEFPIEVSLSACKIGGRQILTAIMFDITERKNLHEQLVQSAKLAAVGELIAGVAHEVNNPLAVVMGYSEMILGEENLDEQLRRPIDVIYNEANRARKVIQNLLSFARKHSPEKQYASINEILERTLSLKEYDLRKNNIELIKKLAPELPASMADPNQLQQVFLNLIINAEQAMVESEESRRQIVVESKVKNGRNKLMTDGDKIIEISFCDCGPGIAEKNLKKIFDPFFTTKPVGRGTGLGLSVSYGIIKEHGGDIFVISKEGEGATFFIELPIGNEIG